MTRASWTIHPIDLSVDAAEASGPDDIEVPSQRVSVFPCGRTAVVKVGLVSLFLSVPISAWLAKVSTKSG